MVDLRAALKDLGRGDVHTVLQSGNVIVSGAYGGTRQLQARIEERIAEALGLRTDAMVRTAQEWHALMAANPFAGEAGDAPERVVLVALKAQPAPRAVATLAKAVAGRERIHADGRQLYLVYPDGISRSNLTGALIERTLAVRGTARNWRTVQRIAERIAPAP